MALYRTYSTEEEKKRQQELQQQNAQKMYDPADTNNSQQYQKAQQPQQNQQAQQPAKYTYQPYTPSSTVQQAQALLQQQLAAKPAGYTSKWQGSIDDTLSQILNRDKFSYDINEDAMYQQLAQQYALYGKQAMMDTVGQVSGLTGGYGNSYAQSAGQQAYQGYLQQLNDRVPEFYQMALTRYNQQGEDLLNRYGMLAQQEGQDYARYQDNMNAYLSELNRLQEEARYADETEYGRYMDWVAQQRYQQELAYQQEQDRIAQDRYQQEFAYQQEQDRIAQEQWQKQYDESVRQWQTEWDENQRRYEESKNAAAYSGGPGGGDDSDEGVEPATETRYPTDSERAEIVGKIENELAVQRGADISTLADYIAELDSEGYDESFTDELFDLYRYLFEKEKASAVDSNEQRIPKKSADKFRVTAKQ